jgi:hypothetical protein
MGLINFPKHNWGCPILFQDTAKLIFFENLFYMLDSDSNGLIAIEDSGSLSHGGLEMGRLGYPKKADHV